MKRPAFLESFSWSTLGVRLLWFIALLYLALFALGAGITAWTSSPGTCATCHEIAPQVASWSTSPHAQVSCPKCHEPTRPLYRYPETFVWRAQMFQRDVTAHRANPNASSLPTSVATERPVPDENCLQCHDLVREVTPPPGLIIDHAKHVARNKSCVSCHTFTAHPVPDAEKRIVMMQQCFKCHGTQPGAKAPGTCTECHPKDFTWRPASHQPTPNWLKTHGKSALASKQPCMMCHEQTFCNGCHGIPIPHPADWAKGAQPAHAKVAEKNVQVCVQCHGPAPNLCSMCHHKGYDPSKGPWATNHAATVAKLGAAWCTQCHESDVFCFRCHGEQGSATVQ